MERRKPISQAKMAELDAKYGVTRLPPDHPIYSEGKQVTLLSQTRRPSKQPDTPANPTDIPTGSDTKLK